MGNNYFDNTGSDQNIAQGDRAIGKQENVMQEVRGDGNIFSGRDIYIEQYGNQSLSPIIPKQCPALEPCFLHREEELAWLNKQLQPGAVAAICGPGGMGKSALAAQAVQRLEPARFPDGIVFHSFYHQPSTEQALQAICTAFQVEVRAVRQVLAGKQALLILDGTEEADDLKAVLRLRSQCGVLLTSRKTEDAPDALLELKPLDKQPAEEVFLRYSGPINDMTSVQEICKLLNGWPVALRIAGRYLRNNKQSAAKYLRWLNKKPFRMLGSGAHQEDNMALLLKRSLKQVSKDAVQAMRVVGALAVAPIRLMPLALLLLREGEDTDELELRSNETMDELVRYGLLETTEHGWQVSHALIHTYASTELPLSRKDLGKIVRLYTFLYKEESKAGSEGYARLDLQRAHCLRLLERCLASKLWQEAKDLAANMQDYLNLQGYWVDALTAQSMRLTAARQAGDRKDEGVCLNSLGYTYDMRGEYDKALTYYEQSLAIFRETGDREGEGTTLNNISQIYDAKGDYAAALKYLEQNLVLFREIGDKAHEGGTLNNISQIYHDRGDYAAALKYLEQSLVICQEIGEKEGEGVTLNNISQIYHDRGDSAAALKYLEQSLAISQEIGDRAGEAVTSWNIGLTYEDQGDLAKAEQYISRVVQLAEEIGHPSLEEYREALEDIRAELRGQ
jgi:tetratricopeptide (TPR) repeat protein